jgi:hypothetical protein
LNLSDVKARDTYLNPIDKLRLTISEASKGTILQNLLSFTPPRYQANVGLIIKDPKLFVELNQIHQTIAKTGVSRSTENFIVGGAQGDSGNIISHLIKENSRGGKDIQISAPYINDPKIVEALVDAARKGSSVSLITAPANHIDPLNRTSSNNKGEAYSAESIGKIIAAGGKVYTPAGDQQLLTHLKSIKIGDNFATIGSHNFTSNAVLSQIEINAVVKDPRIIKQLGKDFQSLIDGGYVQEVTKTDKHINKARLEATGISSNMASMFADPDRGILISSNLGASYFYARSLYNNSMRQSGNGDRVSMDTDQSIASSTYKMAMVIKTGMVPTSIPSAFLDYDRELQTPGLGAAFNEYIAMPLGWGRAYKDELGALPSIAAGFGTLLDRGFLFYTAGNDVTGINTVIDTLNNKDQAYKAGDSQPGLFETLLGAGSAFALQTASAVALYLTVGEPINLLISEGAKESVDAMLNTAIPTDAKGISKYGEMFPSLVRHSVLGLGRGAPNVNSLKANLLLDIAAANKRGGSYYDTENFALSPYHMTSLFRKRADHLLTGIMKPFLVDMVNPYKDGHDKAFVQSIDNLIEEIGSPVRLIAKFGDTSQLDIINNLDNPHQINILFNARNSAASHYEKAYASSKTLISRTDRALEDNQRRISGVKNNTISAGEKNRLLRVLKANDDTDLLSKLSARHTKLNNRIINARAWQGGNSIDTFFNHIAGIDNSTDSLLDAQGRRIKSDKFEFGTAISSVKFVIGNAGEERQIKVAKALQGVLDQVPLNPFRWRVFSAFNGGQLQSYGNGVKPYKAVGDVFSFEDATKMMRNIVLGNGGAANLLARYEVNSNTTTDTGLARTSKNITDRIHTFWNLVVKSPVEAVQGLRDRKKILDSFKASTNAFNAMEFGLGAMNTPNHKFINYADDINASELQKVLSDIRGEGEVLGLYGEALDTFIHKEAYINGRLGSHLDPFTREIGVFNLLNGDDAFFKAISTLSDPVRTTSLQGEAGAQVLSSMSTSFRSASLGVMSLTSTSTLNKRLNNINNISKIDPASKITKNKLFTYVAVALAVTSTLDNLAKSTSGVSLFTQVRTALTAGGMNETKEDLGFNVQFTGESGLFAPGGLTGRIATTTGVSLATLWASKWLAESMQEVNSFTYGFRASTLANNMGDLSLTHIPTNTVIKADELIDFKGTGAFRLEGTARGMNVGLDLIREASDEGMSSLFKFDVIKLSGNTFRNTAIIYTALGAAIWAGSKLTAAALNTARETSGSLDPAAYAIGGALLGSRIKGFGGGLVGFLAGGVMGSLTSAMGMKMTNLGKSGPIADPINMQLASELETFKSLIKAKGLYSASKEELMAGLYAGEYSKVLNLIAGDASNKTTSVIAKQSPLPFLQFFLSESTERIGDMETQTSFSIGIQSAPLLGMNFSVGLPVKYIPGQGVFGFAYNDKNNLLDNYGNLQGAIASSYIGLYAVKAFTEGTNLLPKMMGKNWDIGHRGSVDTLLKLTKTVSDIGNELFISTPIKVIQWMFGSDAYLAYKVAPQLLNSRARGTASIEVGNTITAPSINKARVASQFLIKGVAGAAVGSLVGGFIGAINSDSKNREGNTSSGQWIGAGLGAASNILYQAMHSIRMPLINTAGRLITRHLPDLSNSISRIPSISKASQKLANVTDQFRKTYPRITNTLSSIASNPMANRILKSKVKAMPFLVAAGIGYLMSDSKFGISNGMDADAAIRIGTVGLYAVAAGSIAASIGNMGLSYTETIEKWEKMNATRPIIVEGESPSILKKIKNTWVNFWAAGLDKDMDAILRVTRMENVRANTFFKQVPEATDVGFVAKAANYMADNSLNTAKSVNNAQELGERLRAGEAISETKELVSNMKAGRGAFISNRTFNTLATNRIKRTTLAIMLPSIVFTTIATAIGNGDPEGPLTHMYTSLDRGNFLGMNVGEQVGGSIANAIRLLTFTDGVYKDNKSLDAVHRDDSAFGGGNTLVKYLRMINPTNSAYSKTDALLKNVQSMFVVNAPNPFLNLATPVGFTYRTGEYGSRTNMYIQLQTPGADISTSVYSMGASYMFKEALAGNLDNLMELRAQFRKLNEQMINGKPLNRATLKNTAVNLLSLTAHQQPLMKRRKFSVMDRQVIKQVGADPLLAAVMRDRQNRSRHMAYQPTSSIMSNMLLEGMDNHLLSNKGMLQKYLEGNKDALKTLMDDAFGLVSKNIVINTVNIFSGRSNKDTRTASPQNISDESEYATLSLMRTPETEGPTNPLFQSINSAMSLAGSSMSWVPMAIKVPFILAAAGVLGIGVLHSLGNWAGNQETSALMKQVDDFYTDDWYEIKEVPVGKKVKTVGTINADPLRAPGGAVVYVHDKPKIFINKGATYFDINQEVGSPLLHGRVLENKLIELQTSINMTLTQFKTSPGDGKVISLAAHLTSEANATSFNKELEVLFSNPDVSATKDKVVQKLTLQFESQFDEFIDSYIKALNDVTIDVRQIPALSFLVEEHGLVDGKIKLVSLLGGNYVDTDTIVKMANTTDPDEAISMLRGAISSRGSVDMVGESYKASLKARFRESIKTTLEAEIKGKMFSGNVDASDMLSGGMKLGPIETMQYLSNKILFDLQADPQSPMYVLRHNLGGLGITPTLDLVNRITHSLSSIIKRLGNEKLNSPSEKDIAVVSPQYKKGAPPRTVMSPSMVNRTVASVRVMNTATEDLADLALDYVTRATRTLLAVPVLPSKVAYQSMSIDPDPVLRLEGTNRVKKNALRLIDAIEEIEDTIETLRAIKDKAPAKLKADIDLYIKEFENKLRGNKSKLTALGVDRLEAYAGDTPNELSVSTNGGNSTSMGTITKDGYYIDNKMGDRSLLRPVEYSPSNENPLNSRSPRFPETVETETFHANNTTNRVIEKPKKSVLRRNSALDIPPALSTGATNRVNARFNKNTGLAMKGVGRALELFGTINDMVDTLNIYGAYSRLGASYNSSTYTEAQRLNAANEAGMVTTNIGIGTGVSLALLNAGGISAGIGGAALAATGGLGGLATVGSFGLGAAAVGGAIISAPAWVFGAAILAVSAIVVGLGYAFMSKETKEGLAKSVGNAWRGTSEFIGKTLKGIGDSVGGGRAASSILGGLGLGIGGAVLALGLASTSLIAVPAIVLVASGAAIMGGAGALIGAVAPNQASNFTTAIINQMGQVPIIGGVLGMMVNKPGEWLQLDAKLSQGPFFVGTAGEAIKNEYANRLSAAEDYTGSATSQFFTSDSMHGISNSNSVLLAKGGDLSYLIRPGTMTDPLIDREIRIRSQYYNQTIIGRYLWQGMITQSADYNQIKRLDNNYRNQRAQAAVKTLKAVEEAKAIKNTPSASARRNSNNQNELLQATHLASRIEEMAHLKQRDVEANTKGISIKIPVNKIPTSANINQTRDLGLIRRGINIQTNVSSIAGNKVITTSHTSTASEIANYSILNPSTATPD